MHEHNFTCTRLLPCQLVWHESKNARKQLIAFWPGLNHPVLRNLQTQNPNKKTNTSTHFTLISVRGKLAASPTVATSVSGEHPRAFLSLHRDNVQITAAPRDFWVDGEQNNEYEFRCTERSRKRTVRCPCTSTWRRVGRRWYTAMWSNCMIGARAACHALP